LNISDPTQLCEKVKEIIEDHKGLDTVTVDLREKSSIADYMIIVSGTSNRHLVSMANSIAEATAKVGVRARSIEGLTLADWVLIDLGDVIVHLFRPEIRIFYDLEKMWGVVLPSSALEIA
jgi:ribosome-associated protein